MDLKNIDLKNIKIEDLKEKIPQEQGIKVTDAIKELKESLSQDTEQIKTKLEALKALVNEITTELYKNAAPPPGADGQPNQEQENSEQQSNDKQDSNESSKNEQKTESSSEEKTENS